MTTLTNRLTRRGVRLHLPPRSIQLRLTALYGCLFLVSGAALLALTYTLVAHRYHGGLFAATTRNVLTRAPGEPGTAKTIFSVSLGALVVQSVIALAIMAGVCLWLGWVVAGRVLRPLRMITDAARNISVSDLHRRLALDGPDDELRRLGATFDGLLERLEASFQAQRRFVANASHELRTPLTLQRTLVQVALANPDADTATLREMGEDVLDTSERQERLIDALLTLSRSHSGLDRREPLDLAAATADTLNTLDEHNLTIESALEPAEVSGDPDLLERLLDNLLSNAVRHNLPHGRVEVATRTEPGHAVLTVANTGPTIPREELARLFQPFQRLENHRTNSHQGLGLGLTIIDAIATAHNATLTVAPRTPPEGGLRIEISFPTPS